MKDVMASPGAYLAVCYTGGSEVRFCRKFWDSVESPMNGPELRFEGRQEGQCGPSHDNSTDGMLEMKCCCCCQCSHLTDVVYNVVLVPSSCCVDRLRSCN
jgi:hypothetical protein